MNKLIIFIIAFFLLNNCSFNENSRLWKNKDADIEKELTPQIDKKKIFSKTSASIVPFNPELRLDLTSIITNNKINDDKNNYGSQNYDGVFNKIGNYKFSKLEDVNQIVIDGNIYYIDFER